MFGCDENLQQWVDEMVKAKNHLLEAASEKDGIVPGESEALTTSNYITASGNESFEYQSKDVKSRDN